MEYTSMKKLMSILTLLLFANTASAENLFVTITKVVPVTAEVVERVPNQKCEYAMAPVYGTVRGHDGTGFRRVVVITGYQREYQCRAVMETRIKTRVVHYYVTYNSNGYIGNFRTHSKYNVGDMISVTILN